MEEGNSGETIFGLTVVERIHDGNSRVYRVRLPSGQQQRGSPPLLAPNDHGPSSASDSTLLPLLLLEGESLLAGKETAIVKIEKSSFAIYEHELLTRLHKVALVPGRGRRVVQSYGVLDNSGGKAIMLEDGGIDLSKFAAQRTQERRVRPNH